MNWLLLFLFFWVGATARADDLVRPASAELELEPELKLADPDPTEGFGVIALGAELAFVDQGFGNRNRDLNGGPGVHMQILANRKWWPVMVGLGFGLLAFDSVNELRLGRAASTQHGSSRERYDWSTASAVQLRHFELVTRYQPYWGLVRPYAELALGLAAFWYPDEEHQRTASVFYGGTLGIDWRLRSHRKGSDGSWSLTLTTALKRMGTGPVDRPLSSVIDGANGRGYVDAWSHEALSFWTPYLGLAFTIDSRHEARVLDE